MTITLSGAPLLSFLIASIRITSWMAVAPPFNNRAIPPMAKVILALSLSMLMAPELANQTLPSDFPSLFVVIITQVAVGVAMGFVTMLLFSAIQAAGSLIDLFGGFQLAAAFDPLSLNTNSVFGRFHEMLAFVLLVTTGGHLLVLGGLLNTFRYLPIDGSPDLSSWPTVFTTAVGMFFSVAFQIALPLAAVLFVSDLALALLTKVAPALNAFTIMFPVKIALTLMLVGLSFPVLPNALERLISLINDAIGTLGGAS